MVHNLPRYVLWFARYSVFIKLFCLVAIAHPTFERPKFCHLEAKIDNALKLVVVFCLDLEAKTDALKRVVDFSLRLKFSPSLRFFFSLSPLFFD